MCTLLFCTTGIATATAVDLDNVVIESVSQDAIDDYTAAAAFAVANHGEERHKEMMVSREKRNYKSIDESNTKLSADAPWRHDGKRANP